jgi:ADP-ribose pyrophosphatase
MKPKILSCKVKYKGIWAKIRQGDLILPDGKNVSREDVISNDAVAILPLDKDNNVYFSKEWRSAWEKEILEIPAGICNAKTRKKPLVQAKNELAEELGFGAKKWERMVTYLLGGRQKSKIHVFLARDLYEFRKKPDEGEIITVVRLPFKKACNIFLNGKKETTSYTVVGLALAKDKLKL